MKSYIVSYIKCFPDELMERECEVFSCEAKALKYFDSLKSEFINKYIDSMSDIYQDNTDDIRDYGTVTETSGYWQFVEQDGGQEVLIIFEEKEVR